MPRRELKRRLHLVDSRTLDDDGLRHVGFEYGSSTLCGRRMLTLDASEAKGREPCEDCAQSAAWRTARSA